MKAAYGVVDMVRDVPSRGVTRIVVELPIEMHVEATKLFYQQRVLVTLAPGTVEGAFGIRGDDAPTQTVEQVTRPTRPPIGSVCKLAVQWCADARFHDWLAGAYPEDWGLAEAASDEEKASIVVRLLCDVASRRELDERPARDAFMGLVHAPFREYLKQRAEAEAAAR